MADAPQSPHDPIEPALSEAASFVAGTLDALLPQAAGPEAQLLDAMRAAVLSAGSPRLHPFLVLQSGRLFGVDRRVLGRVAAAVECVDACALAHGGLAGFGAAASRPCAAGTLAATFGEATAVLAGDALLALSFSLLGSQGGIGDPFIRSELMVRLAQSAGHAGLVGGQMLEAVFAGESAAAMPPLPEISRLQRMRTAALTMFCCEAGAMLGHASPPARHALSAYGQDIGLAFQIAADLVASDVSANMRPTVVSALGPERARAQAAALSSQALRHLDLFDEKADLLRSAAGVAKRMAGVAAG